MFLSQFSLTVPSRFYHSSLSQLPHSSLTVPSQFSLIVLSHSSLSHFPHSSLTALSHSSLSQFPHSSITVVSHSSLMVLSQFPHITHSSLSRSSHISLTVPSQFSLIVLSQFWRPEVRNQYHRAKIKVLLPLGTPFLTSSSFLFLLTFLDLWPHHSHFCFHDHRISSHVCTPSPPASLSEGHLGFGSRYTQMTQDDLLLSRSSTTSAITLFLVLRIKSKYLWGTMMIQPIAGSEEKIPSPWPGSLYFLVRWPEKASKSVST